MNKGIVYKIEFNDEIYIGSTEQKLCSRQAKHNNYIKKYPNRKLYKKCIEEGIEKIKCIWVADIEFNSTAEKRAIEEEYRKDLNATLNSIRCYTTLEEYKQDKKEYYEKNKEQLKEKYKDYYKNYRNANKEKYKEYWLEYYDEKKEEIVEKNKVKVECPNCKCMISKYNMSKHRKTKKCLNYNN
tara:strand:- start:994 stop:1545 length:552 start_codon:yes stop_codon:yes gene_type:complete